MFRLISGIVVAIAATHAVAQPDLVCSEITSATSFGTNGAGLVAYSFGTTICNEGGQAASWMPSTNEHPLISQTLYKLKDHRFSQIGIGFVRHTTIPLQGNACSLGCMPGSVFELGAGCSDVSSSAINGSQAMMGPRTEVNALTGHYPYPFTSINQTGDAVYKRLQVELADVSDPDALYFVETQIVGIDESGFDAVVNNCAYRQVTFTPGSATATLVGPTYSGPAIYAWRDHGNGIGVPDEDVMISWRELDDAQEYVFLGSKATELGLNHWLYDYGVYNMNGNRGVGGFFVNLCDGKSQLIETQFQSPSYHDDLDEQILNQSWDVNHDPTSTVSWTVEEYEQDPYANAIRWGTMYSFAFEVQNQRGPSQGELAGIAPFGPGEISDVAQYGVPSWSPPHCDTVCRPDLAGNPDGTPDGQLNFSDLSAFLQLYASQDSTADFLVDGQFNFLDMSAYLQAYAAGCP